MLRLVRPLDLRVVPFRGFSAAHLVGHTLSFSGRDKCPCPASRFAPSASAPCRLLPTPPPLPFVALGGKQWVTSVRGGTFLSK